MVLTVKVAEVFPELTVMVEGTVAAELFDVSATVMPPTGAAAVRVTVPTVDVPPNTDVGENVTVEGPPLWAKTLLTNPEKITGPHPVTVSHPATAFDGFLFGSVPLLPEMTSKNTVASPLNE